MSGIQPACVLPSTKLTRFNFAIRKDIASSLAWHRSGRLFWGTGRLQECNTCFFVKEWYQKSYEPSTKVGSVFVKSTFLFPSSSRQRALRKRNYIDIYIYIDHFPITKLWKKVKTVRRRWKKIRYIGATRVWRLEKNGPNLQPCDTHSPWDTYHVIPLPTCCGSVAWFRARRSVAKNGGHPGLRWE